MQGNQVEEMKERSARIAGRYGVAADFHPLDHLFWAMYDADPIGAVESYFASGAVAATLVRDLLRGERTASFLQSFSLLEFASGYGRVSRHWKNILPNATVTACDIHPEAVEFLESIEINAISSATNPDEFDPGQKYDVIFALSFFTHLPRETWARWLCRLAGHVAPSGLFFFTTHGQASLGSMAVLNFDRDGFWFGPYSEQKDLDPRQYGHTATSFDYVYSQILSSGLKLILYKEAGFGHQDLYALQRR